MHLLYKKFLAGEAGGSSINTLAPGVPVILQGISSTPELNGQRGVLSRWDDKLERWRVKMSQDGKTRALR